MLSGRPNKRLVVLDPGLEGKSGHHYALFDAARRASANNRVFEIKFYVHRKIHDPCRFAEIEQYGRDLKAHFSEHFYQYYKARPTFAAVGDYVVRLGREYKHALVDALKNSSSDQSVIFLYPSMQWEHLAALSTAINELDCQGLNKRNVQHKICLMFNPGMDFQGKITNLRESLAYKMALRPLIKNSRIDIYASDFELSKNFGRLLSRVVPTHPCYLYDFPRLEYGGEANKIPQGAERKIGLYHGDAKREKGFLELPAFLSALLAHLEPADKVFIQFTLTGEDHSLNTAARLVEDIAKGDRRVQLVRGFVTDSELISHFSTFSEYCFLHDTDHYKDKSSGIAWLAAYFKCPAYVLGDSWLSRELSRLGVSVRPVSSAKAVALPCGDMPKEYSKGNERLRSAIYGDFWQCLGVRGECI